MATVIDREEEEIIQKFRGLSPARKREVADFLDLLSSREKAKPWPEFDEWTLNVAQKKGFDRLTEKDVARIVSDFRSGR